MRWRASATSSRYDTTPRRTCCGAGEPGSDDLRPHPVPKTCWPATGEESSSSTHFAEKEHLGVLIGVPITDMKLTLLTGRAHEKHTEGGRIRQATSGPSDRG